MLVLRRAACGERRADVGKPHSPQYDWHSKLRAFSYAGLWCMRNTMSITFFFSVLLSVLFAACAPEPQSTRETERMTLTPLPRVSTPSPLPVLTPDADSASAQDASAVGGAADCPDNIRARGADDAAVGYALEASYDWLAHTLHAEQRVIFYNDTDQPLDEIVFNVEPNRIAGEFALERVEQDAQRVQDYELVDAWLMVPLGDSLPVDCATELTLWYTLQVPPIAADYQHGHLGYRGYSARQVNLGFWFPLVAAFDPLDGWVSPPYHAVGEHHVLRTADFDVTMAVKNAPEGVHIAGPGKVTEIDDHTWRFELRAAREVAFSLSDRFRTLTMITESGVEVTLYYLFNDANPSLDAPRHTLTVAADAIALYEMRFGACPHERIVVVEGDFPDGMEFSGLVFVSEAWFRTWKNMPNDWLTLITVHEIAHQWWYDLIANDQGRYPFLDEALATYSELLFFEHYYPEQVEWWWDFRVRVQQPMGNVDTPVYAFQAVRPYINAVYLRGALMMQDLRETLGDDVFFAWLEQYAAGMTQQIAYPKDFWGVLTPEQYAQTQSVRQTYLQGVDILPQREAIP